MYFLKRQYGAKKILKVKYSRSHDEDGRYAKSALNLQNYSIPEPWYVELGSAVLTKACTSHDPGLTLTYFTARSILAH